MKGIGMRKAALALAAMHSADRRWMLGKISGSLRSALVPLIDEAQQHIALDADLLRAVLADEPTHFAREVPPPDVLIVVLDRLSTVWAARILAAVAQDHAEIYLAACTPARAKSIRLEMKQLPDPLPRAFVDTLSVYLSEAALEARMAGDRP